VSHIGRSIKKKKNYQQIIIRANLRIRITTKLLDLQKLCLDPTTKETYIRPDAITVGGNVSTENLGKGFDLGFVIEFDTFEQLQYYVHKDPAHNTYKEFVGKLVEDAFVFDIEY
jgi:hypothetical protein